MAEQIHPRVAQVLEADRAILDTFGMTVEEARAGTCRLRATVPATLVNAAGFAHGGVAFALLDTACAYALGSLEVRGVTINANTTFVKGASAGSQLEAVVSVVSRSRRVATLRGEIFLTDDAEPLLAAHGSFVFQLIEVRAS